MIFLHQDMVDQAMDASFCCSVTQKADQKISHSKAEEYWKKYND